MIDFKKPSGPLLLLLYVLLALVVITFVFSGSIKPGTYGLNKTVGWAYDIFSLVVFSVILSVLVFVLGYTILVLFRARVNKVVSIINTAILFLSMGLLCVLGINSNYWPLPVLLSLISVILLFVNIGFAIRYKLIDKKRNK